MGRIFLLVGAAIVIFMAFTAYSVRKELQGRAQLAAIKDMYFPLLQRLDANIVRLDKIQELYIQVVITGDRATIDKAAELGEQADAAFGEITALYPGHEQAAAQLRSDLKQYQKLATATSLAFLDKDRAAAGPMALSMNRALAEVEARLKALRQSGYDEFVRTLAGSQRDAVTRLIMGLALGLMNLGFMVVLVHFIRNNLKMMALIAVQNATLEHRVSERTAQLSQKTADINAMLQNMKIGVSTVVPGNTIHVEHSEYLRTIFSNDELAGKDLIATLFANSNLGIDSKDQIAVALGAILGEDAMMFALNGHLLAQEIRLEHADGTHKIVQMDWSPIVNERDVIDKVLLISQDVTHLRALEHSSAQQQDELSIISRIIKLSIGKLNDFVESARGFAAANRRLINDTPARDEEAIAALFRNMHTIKGNARMFEFVHITNAAHAAEQSYDRLRKDASAEWSVLAMLAELDAVDGAIQRYVSVSEDTLGRKGRASDLLTTRGVFISNEQLSALRSQSVALSHSQPSAELTELQQSIGQLGLIPLPRLISGSIDSVSSLAKQLKKATPSVEIVNGDFGFTSQFAEALKTCCMHIVRNSMDHGIEAPEERVRVGKPEQGCIRFRCEQRGEQMELHISDDGKGLALQRLYQKGLEAGLFDSAQRPTRASVAELIFRSGLSTASAVSDVSGRGVGMDAVQTFLKEQEASIRIVLSEPAGTELGDTPFEFVISVPAGALGH